MKLFSKNMHPNSMAIYKVDAPKKKQHSKEHLPLCANKLETTELDSISFI